MAFWFLLSSVGGFTPSCVATAVAFCAPAAWSCWSVCPNERTPSLAPFSWASCPHLHFGKIAFDRLGDKGLAGSIARPRLCPRAEAGAGQGRCKAHTYNQPCHDFSPSEGLRLNKRHDEGWCSRLTERPRSS